MRLLSAGAGHERAAVGVRAGVAAALCPLLLLLALPAAAETGVFAPFGLLGLPQPEGAKVQRWVRAAAETVPGYRWLASSRLKPKAGQEEACLNSVSCLGSLARAAGADALVAGEVGSLGGGYMVYLRLVNSAGGRLRTANAVLDPHAPGLRQEARSLVFELLRPDLHTGTLEVQVDVRNAWIYLDGRRLARSPLKSIEGVAVGTHALRVTHEAYRDYVRFVKVEFEKPVRVPVELSAFPVRSEEMRLLGGQGPQPLTSGELPWYRRWWAVTAFGAVILAGATTTMAILMRGSVPFDQEAVVRP